MRLLLDTHVLLWWLAASEKLGKQARSHIAEPESEVWVSAATAWEISIKVSLGRLHLEEPPEVCLPREMKLHRFRPLPIEHAHALAIRGLPAYHADPFDRMLVAQAQVENLTIVTADSIIARYGIAIVDARR